MTESIYAFWNVIMQVFRYIAFIWEDYEKEQEKKKDGISKTEGSPQYLLQVMSEIIEVFLAKLNVPGEEADAFTDRIKERKMGELFKHFEGWDVQALRREAKEEVEKARKEVKKEVEKARKEAKKEAREEARKYEAVIAELRATIARLQAGRQEGL